MKDTEILRYLDDITALVGDLTCQAQGGGVISLKE